LFTLNEIFEDPACAIFNSEVLSPALKVTVASLVKPSFFVAPTKIPVFLFPEVAESESQSAVSVAVQDLFVLMTIKLASFQR